jgi:hypothetical protein
MGELQEENAELSSLHSKPTTALSVGAPIVPWNVNVAEIVEVAAGGALSITVSGKMLGDVTADAVPAASGSTVTALTASSATSVPPIRVRVRTVSTNVVITAPVIRVRRET